MSNLNETEKGISALLKIMADMELIDFEEAEITINHEGKEYTVILTKESVDIGTEDRDVKHDTQIKIKCTNEGEITLNRHYTQRVVRGSCGCDTHSTWYKGEEILPNGERVQRKGYGETGEKALESLKTFIDRNVKGISLKLVQGKDNAEIIESEEWTYEKTEDKISVTKTKKPGQTEQNNLYFCDTTTNEYYLESKQGNAMPLKEANKKLEQVEDSLKKATKALTEATESFSLVGMPQIDVDIQFCFDGIASQKEEFHMAQKNIQTAIEDKYFPENQQWTNFSEDALVAIHGAIADKLAELREESMKRQVEEKARNLSPDVIQYVKTMAGNKGF